MSIELIYRTTDAAALASARATLEARKPIREAREAYRDRMTEEFGPTPKLRGEFKEKRELVVSGQLKVTGLDAGHREFPPDESGWRLDSKTGFWKPRLVTQRGKERREELDALALPDWDFVALDMDGLYWGDTFMATTTIGVREDLGEVWALWSRFDCRKAMHQNSVTWDEMPRSEFYAWFDMPHEERPELLL